MTMKLLRKLARYATVSAISTSISMTILGVLVAPSATPASWANVVATSVGMVPSFERGRQRRHLRDPLDPSIRTARPPSLPDRRPSCQADSDCPRLDRHWPSRRMTLRLRLVLALVALVTTEPPTAAPSSPSSFR
jgi:hypothetical protein